MTPTDPWKDSSDRFWQLFLEAFDDVVYGGLLLTSIVIVVFIIVAAMLGG